jgi:hypothetical protein
MYNIPIISIPQAVMAASADKNSTAHMAIHFTTNHPRHNTYSKCVKLVFAANQSPSVAAPTCVMPHAWMLQLSFTSRCMAMCR